MRELNDRVTEVEVSTFLMNIDLNLDARMLVRRMMFEIDAYRSRKSPSAEAVQAAVEALKECRDELVTLRSRTLAGVVQRAEDAIAGLTGVEGEKYLQEQENRDGE